MDQTSIYALSSGGLPSGVAVVRMSGPGVRFAFETMLGFVPEPRKLVLSDINGLTGSGLLDRGLSVYFDGPYSFTGEDCGEFQIHGGLAVVNSVLEALGKLKGFRLAEPGEFSRRSFENGKLDLTEVEGLSDLIASQTEMQRIQALKQSKGDLHRLYEGWLNRLVHSRAMVEAGLDFSDQDDVSIAVSDDIFRGISSVWKEISEHLDDNNHGEIIRCGFKIALMGPVNSGKSSLINALAKRDVAIVSPVAGTTRDVIEVNLDINGYKVIVSDTAGIRDTEDVVEKIGIDRALDNAVAANLVVWLAPLSDCDDLVLPEGLDLLSSDKLLIVRSKSDLVDGKCLEDFLSISVLGDSGLTEFMKEISVRIEALGNGYSDPLPSRRRHKELLLNTKNILGSFAERRDCGDEILCETLRSSIFELGKIVGRVDIEDIYEVIFSEFCIGK